MKYLLLTLSLMGIIVSSLALREHYREYGDSPCPSTSTGIAAWSITAALPCSGPFRSRRSASPDTFSWPCSLFFVPTGF